MRKNDLLHKSQDPFNVIKGRKRDKMKRTLSALLSLILIFSALGGLFVSAADTELKVTVNGKLVAFTDAAPFIDENSRTLVPLRAVADAMGLQVTWDEKNRIATFSKAWSLSECPGTWDQDGDGKDESYYSKKSIEFYPNSFECQGENEMSEVSSTGSVSLIGYNYPWQEMDTTAVIKDGRMYAPIRYLAEYFFFDVLWNSVTRTVEIVDAMDYDGSYHWSLKDTPDASKIFFSNKLNITSAEITSVLITGWAPEAISDKPAFTHLSAADLAAEKVDTDGNLLDGISFVYDFKEGVSYQIHIELEAVKENGATLTNSYTINLDVD